MVKIITIFFMTFLISCSKDIENKNYNLSIINDKHSYLQMFEFYPDSLMRHFPEFMPTGLQDIFINEGSYLMQRGFLYTHTFIKRKFDKVEFAKLNDTYKKNAIAEYDSTSENLLVLFFYFQNEILDNETNANQFSFKQKLAKNNKESKEIPIPYFDRFEEYSRRNTVYGLPYEYKVYVLGASPGYHIPEKFRSDFSEECMPEKWEHGYSKGVAVNEKTYDVIFWVAVW